MLYCIAQQSLNLIFSVSDYTLLAARIVVANLHKETKKVFSEVMADLYNMRTHDRPTPMISKAYHDIIQKNAERLNSAIVYDRDFNYQVCILISSKYGYWCCLSKAFFLNVCVLIIKPKKAESFITLTPTFFLFGWYQI